MPAPKEDELMPSDALVIKQVLESMVLPTSPPPVCIVLWCAVERDVEPCALHNLPF